jgi:pimeloyl-ACP methyl ester carboxylesterase
MASADGDEEMSMSEPITSGYAPVNGLNLYWESRGSGGTPLIAVPGGYGRTTMFGDALDALAARRRVIAIELQGHGHTGDIERPFTYEAFGDDLAGLIDHLELGRADLLGVSLGAGACLRAAIQHPDKVRKLAVVSFPFRREGWFPEILAAFDNMSRAQFEMMRQSFLYDEWAEVAPDKDAFPTVMDKIGELLRRPYDWSDEVAKLEPETLLVFADADSIPPSHAAAFYALLGGGLRDADWDESGRVSTRLAILPGTTHYSICSSPGLTRIADYFFV